MIQQKTVTRLHPALDKPISLSVGHFDAATLALTFHYQELVQNGTWQTVDHQQALAEGTHYSVDAARGQITLLPHAFWEQESTWRAGDRTEPLLYKGRVKHPQHIEASFDHWVPAQVTISVDKTQITGDGVDASTVTIEADDPTLTEVDVDVMCSDEMVGTMTLPVGDQPITAEMPSKYTLRLADVRDGNGWMQYRLAEDAKPVELEVV